MEIIPAILESEFKAFRQKIESVKGLAKRIQIDVIDGQFVAGRTVQLDDFAGYLKTLAPKPILEAHLMVSRPGPLVDPYFSAGFEAIIMHVESPGLSESLVARIRRQHRHSELGLAINPETPVSQLEPYIAWLDVVLVMTVVPGAQGRSFIPKALEKIGQLRQDGFNDTVAIDGGVNLETLSYVLKSQDLPDRVTAGSGLFKTNNVADQYQALVKAVGGS